MSEYVDHWFFPVLICGCNDGGKVITCQRSELKM